MIPEIRQIDRVRRKEFLSATRHQNLVITSAKLERDSFIRITAYNSAGIFVNVSGENYDDDSGDVNIFQLVYAPPADRLAQSLIIPMTQGYLISLRVSTTGVATRGQCFIVAEIQKGNSVTPIVSQLLFSDYLVTNQSLSFPGSPIISPSSGIGRVYVPALSGGGGQNPIATVPTNALWKLISAGGTYTTDATVIVREPLISIVSVAATFPTIRFSSQNSQPQSVAVSYNWVNGQIPPELVTMTGPAYFMHTSFPQGIILLAGGSVAFDAYERQAGDAWGVTAGFVVEELINF